MQVEQPLFTVATVTYNSRKWVKQAIESILASSFEHFELIISDDCSTDDTWEIIQQYKDSRIRAWRNEFNLGEYPNRNKVLNSALGKYILFVDGDDILYRDSLRNLSEYVKAFPHASMLWGLNPQFFPFYVFPYLVQPPEVIKLIYLTLIPISTIGFGEILFNTDMLRSIGGMSEKFKMGDVYIKKKLALRYPVLFVSIGFMFWRQSPHQASKKIVYGFKSFLERVAIDEAILGDPLFPLGIHDKAQVALNLRITTIKILVSSSLLKGRIKDFIFLLREINFNWNDFFMLFRKGYYNYTPSCDLGSPLLNTYHFTKSISSATD